MANLYWSVYLNLENELCEIAKLIHFCDEQLKVYSMHIADLLVRTCIEIEAISKELYRSLNGKMDPVDANGNYRNLYFDTDCLSLIEEKWRISEKEVIISSAYFYFQKFAVLTPLKKSYKRGKSGTKWKQAYQDVKHDRYQNLPKGNIQNLIEAMAALYLLNLFYSNQIFSEKTFDSRVGSQVFSTRVADATAGMKVNMNDSAINWRGDPREKSMFIIKMTEEEIRNWHKSYCAFIHSLNNSIDADPRLQKSAIEDRELFGNSIDTMLKNMNGNQLWADAILKARRECKKYETCKYDNEVVVNMNQQIYPALQWSDIFPDTPAPPKSLINRFVDPAIFD